MKKLFRIFLLLMLMTACKNDSGSKNEQRETSILNITFSDFKEISFLEDHEKVTDTSLVNDAGENVYRLTELKKENKTLILFNKITHDSLNNESYQIVDTLNIPRVGESEFLTIGYCLDQGTTDQEIIALIETTDSLHTNKVNRAWRANMKTEKFEKIGDVQGITCFNEFFENPEL